MSIKILLSVVAVVVVVLPFFFFFFENISTKNCITFLNLFVTLIIKRNIGKLKKKKQNV